MSASLTALVPFSEGCSTATPEAYTGAAFRKSLTSPRARCLQAACSDPLFRASKIYHAIIDQGLLCLVQALHDEWHSRLVATCRNSQSIPSREVDALELAMRSPSASCRPSLMRIASQICAQGCCYGWASLQPHAHKPAALRPFHASSICTPGRAAVRVVRRPSFTRTNCAVLSHFAHPVLAFVPPDLCLGLLSGFMQCHSYAYKHTAALPSSKRSCLKSCNSYICPWMSQASAHAEVPTDLAYAALQQAMGQQHCDSSFARSES